MTNVSIDEYAVTGRDGGPYAVTSGPDGALWFTEYRSHRIGRVTTDGTATEFPLPTPECGPYGLAAGPDGALWFTEIAAGQIGRITTDGAITEFPLPDRSARPHAITPTSEPHGIVLGPDGALWAALETGSLARVRPR
ncbi:hypothetical protein ABGB12_28385 [Actinocorallia sp. B10E7]|uniref:Vgb family protein n=1 Tax=Actinocorallia sp. B10E7 TaxID=3153558 RepID=UPI00325D72FE